MKTGQAVIKRIFAPPLAAELALILLSLILLAFVFSPVYSTGVLFTVISCLIAGYALASLCLGFRDYFSTVNDYLMSKKYSGLYLADVPFRVHINVHLSLVANLAYASFRLIVSILTSSVWQGALAGYYACLSATRVFLARKLPNSQENIRPEQELRDSHTVGYFMLVLSFAVAAIIVQMLRDGQRFSYPGYMIYIVSAYTLVYLAITMVSIIRYRHLGSPILLVTKAINLSTAVVSLYCLQTALMSTFGEGGKFQTLMNIISGGVVWLIIYTVAIYVLIMTKKQINKNT